MGKRIHRQIGKGVLCLFFMLLFTACASTNRADYYRINDREKVRPEIKTKEELPYLGIILNGYFIQPTSGSYTKVSPFTYQRAVTVCDDSGLNFWSRGKLEQYDKELRVYRVKDEKVIWEQNYFELNFRPQKLPEGELFLLRIILSKDNRELTYDFPFYYSTGSQFRENVRGIIKEVLARKSSQEKQMGNVALRIDEVDREENIRGIVKKIVSTDTENGREYLDKIYSFQFYRDGGITWVEKARNKKRGNYDRNRKGVIFHENGQWYENDGRFIYMEEDEIYALEGKYIYPIYRKDKLNDDYLIDEIGDIRFRSIGWNANKYYFIAYGNMAMDIPKYSNYRGIGFFEWDGRGLNTLFFMEIDVAEIESYIAEKLIIENNESKVYWVQQGAYYQIDLLTQSVKRQEVPYYSRFDRNLFLYFWQAQNDKNNQFVYWNNIYTQKMYGIMEEYTNQQIIGMSSQGIYVGEYQLANTLEYANRKVEYPFDKVVLYSINGLRLGDIKPPAKSYFGMPVFLDTGDSYLPILQKVEDGSSVSYRIVGKEKIEMWKLSESYGNMHTNSVTMAMKLVKGGQEAEELRVINGSVTPIAYSRGKAINLNMADEPENDYYFVRANETVLFTNTLQDALAMAKKYPHHQVYYVNAVGQKKVYDSKWKKNVFVLDLFNVENQGSSMKRGQAVVSLAMLLHYHNPSLPDKYKLASEMMLYGSSESTTGKYKVNMKEGFAGNVYSAREEGIGVYIEPVALVARRYMGARAQNITGASLNQILTLVSNGQPVQVMVADSLQVPKSDNYEVWQTTTGYMQVNHQLHSVVVIGFDAIFVYYANPATGRIEKVLRREFEASYQSFGSQALVITE